MGSVVSTRHLYTSFANHRRLAEASAILRSLPGNSEIVVLAPTRGAADDFVRACSDQEGSAFGVHRLTPVQLAAALATDYLAGHNLAPISRLGMEALAARSIHVCRKEAKLDYFDPVAETPGFSRALAATLSELRLEQVDRDHLASTGTPGRDLARLLECYERQLTERQLADLAIIFAASTGVAGHARHRLLGLPLLWLDVTAESTLERVFLAAVAERSPSVVATAPAADRQGVQALAKILGVSAEPVEDDEGEPAKADGRARTQRVLVDESSQNSLHRLRRHVFESQAPAARKLDDSVDFFSGPGEGLECVEIARRIRAAAERGVSFDQMAILLRNVDAYLPLVQDALRRAGVPGYFTRGTIRPDPSGRAFLALLDCAAERLSASKFAQYLSLGQVPVVNESGAPREPAGIFVAPDDEAQGQFSFMFPGSTGVPPAGRALSVAAPLISTVDETPAPSETDESPVVEGTLRTPFGWEKLLIDAAVIGGKDRWSRRLRGLRAEYDFQLKELEGDDDSRREYLEKQLKRLDNLERFALPLIEFLDSLPTQALWAEWLQVLKRLAEMALRHPESVLSVLGELEPMDEVGPVELGEVRRVLSERLSFLRHEPPTRRYGHVFVGTIGEAAGRSFELVFLPGLAEGIFPRKPFEDPLLLDEYRRQLDSSLATQDKRLIRERLLLTNAIAAARTSLSVSYPRMDTVQGRARVPSFYALEVLRAAEGRLPALGDLERRAAEGVDSRLGWPAPKDPKLALDDAEYDLVVLDELLHRPAKDVKGHARYLLSVSTTLARSLRTRSARWNRRAWSGADGIVDADVPTLAILATQRLTDRSYSPSALQHFAVCPYKFLLYAIHRLQERVESAAIEKLDPLTRGGLFHAAQFEIFRELQRTSLLPVTEENLARVLETADRMFGQVAKKYEEDLAPAIPQIWKSEIEDLGTDLRGWIRQLVSIHAEWLPIHFEYAFGLRIGPERDPESSPGEAVILDRFHLRGSIDLVEQHRTRDVLRVTDHKTGKVPPMKPASVGGGEILQPLLYGLAATELLRQKVESGLLYYTTQRGRYEQVDIPLSDSSLERIRLVMSTVEDGIEKGFLPAAPRKDACKFCDYRIVCGPYEERRVKHKAQDRLDALQQIRCLP